MRKYLFYFVLLLAGCGSNGDESSGPGILPAGAEHKPEITNVTFSPATALRVDGGGAVTVAAEITVEDAGLDIQTLRVRLPDDKILMFDETIATQSATVIEEFTLSVETAGAFEFVFWFVDSAKNISNLYSANFKVVYDIQSGGWTNRLSGLTYALNDVIWDGSVFIAVGSEGAVLTSADGIDWVERESGTDAELSSVAFYESDVYAVGDKVVLLSTDHGETWITKAELPEVALTGIAVSATQLVVSGYRTDLDFTTAMMISEDRGDTWQAIDSLPADPVGITDMIYRDGLFIVTADGESFFYPTGGKIYVSTNGAVWSEVIHDSIGLRTVTHDGNQFIAGGYNGAVVTSMDGYNWTEIETPVPEITYSGAASDGSKLMLTASYRCMNLHGCSPPEIELPAGTSTTDGGVTWDIFTIDGDFESRGLASGNGLFVSVGDAAIYTAE